MIDARLLAIEPDIYRRWAHETRGRVWSRDSPTEHEAASRLQPVRRNVGSVAVVSLSGFISPKPSLMTLLFGGTSLEGLVADMRQLAADDSIGAIVLNIDSPGGSVFGLAEAAPAIRALRGSKPIIAVGNHIMASAAYYVAAQADEIVASPSALVGSIGTIAVVLDDSEALDKAGLKLEVFTYGKRKAELMTPLDEAGRDALQAQVDYYGEMFEADVAKGRGVSVSRVRGGYGQGALFNARPALDAGVVDRIDTLEGVISGLASGRRPKPRPAARADSVELQSWALRVGLPIRGD